MSNVIPPLLSDSPPPPPDIDDHEEDEFGDFIGTNNLSYDCDDNFSPPGSPLLLPTDSFDIEDPLPEKICDINSNNKDHIIYKTHQVDTSRDTLDKRKGVDPKPAEHFSIHELTLPEELSNDSCGQQTDADGKISFSELETNEINTEKNCDTKITSNHVETEKSGSEIIEDSVEFLSDNLTVNTSYDLEPATCRNIPENSLEEDENISTKSSIEESTSFHMENDSRKSGTDLEIPNNLYEDVTELSDLELDDKEKIEMKSDVVITEDDFSTLIVDEKDLIIEDEFGDFASVSVQSGTKQKPIDDEKHIVDDFGDFNSAGQTDNIFRDFSEMTAQQGFADFASFPPPPEKKVEPADGDDDFGDFAMTSDVMDKSSEEHENLNILLLNENQALEKSSEILKEIFPPLDQIMTEFEFKGLEVNDKVFNKIKNITETNALAFQWPNSASQKVLLKALNIDSRNILYEPYWNSSKPRFAANLSFTPLQPIKSEVLMPAPVREANTSDSIPVASNVDLSQFDLTPASSNTERTQEFSPQSTILDLEQLESQLYIPKFKNTFPSHNLSLPSNEWETWLQSIQSKDSNTSTTDKIKPLELPVSDPKHEIPRLKEDIPVIQSLDQKSTAPVIKHDDFDDFVSYASPSHGHSIILRETHISNKEPNKSEDSDIVSWLEPTIVTPELSRKDRQFVDAEEEFDDFQVVVPEDHSSKSLDVVGNSNVNSQGVLQPQTIVRKESDNGTGSKEAENIKIDDEFGDFTFSLPIQTKNNISTPGLPLAATAMLEPLKPSVLPTVNSSVPISWPDPGITDDEISRFEALGYSRMQHPVSARDEKPVSVLKQKKDTELNLKSKQKSEDDEWSEFVSVKNTSPVHKLKAEKERSSTPDLPLSVLNLGSIQPTKQPIPVITPNGLVQTKLSSNLTLSFPNIMQQTNPVYRQASQTYNPSFQPSIISNQFANQAYASFNHYVPTTAGSTKPSIEDDEWSDFVSHQQPAHQKINQTLKPSQVWSGEPNKSSNWASNAPNIIANPASGFDVFGSSSAQKPEKKVLGSVQGNRTVGVSSVSVPDLDFLAPRSRTTQRK